MRGSLQNPLNWNWSSDGGNLRQKLPGFSGWVSGKIWIHGSAGSLLLKNLVIWCFTLVGVCGLQPEKTLVLTLLIPQEKLGFCWAHFFSEPLSSKEFPPISPILQFPRANAMTRYDESPGRSVAGGRVARNSPVDEKRLREQWSKNPPGVRCSIG